MKAVTESQAEYNLKQHEDSCIFKPIKIKEKQK